MWAHGSGPPGRRAWHVGCGQSVLGTFRRASGGGPWGGHGGQGVSVRKLLLYSPLEQHGMQSPGAQPRRQQKKVREGCSPLGPPLPSLRRRLLGSKTGELGGG